MGKVTKVTSVQGNGTWEGQHGVMYKFDYEFEDGNGLQAMHKTKENAFKVGDTVEYEVTRINNEYGSSGKVYKPKEIQGASQVAQVSADVWRKKDVAIIYQNALTQANTFYNVVGYNGKSADQSLQVLMDTADVIARFVIEKSGI